MTAADLVGTTTPRERLQVSTGEASTFIHLEAEEKSNPALTIIALTII